MNTATRIEQRKERVAFLRLPQLPEGFAEHFSLHKKDGEGNINGGADKQQPDYDALRLGHAGDPVDRVGRHLLFQEIAVQELPVFTIVSIRVLIAALLLWAVTALTGNKLPSGVKIWAALFLLALVNNVIPFTLIVWGQQEISSGLAAILNATVPLFTVLIAHFVTTDEKLTRAKFAGVIIGLVGVVVIIGEDALEGIGLAVLAQLAVLVASLAYTFRRTLRA